jgi:hypothetical protein
LQKCPHYIYLRQRLSHSGANVPQDTGGRRDVFPQGHGTGWLIRTLQCPQFPAWQGISQLCFLQLNCF